MSEYVSVGNNSVAREAYRLVKLRDRFNQLRSMRQAKVHMIAEWTKEIHAIDEEVRAMIEEHGNDLGLGQYPQWLQELIVVDQRQRQVN